MAQQIFATAPSRETVEHTRNPQPAMCLHLSSLKNHNTLSDSMAAPDTRWTPLNIFHNTSRTHAGFSRGDRPTEETQRVPVEARASEHFPPPEGFQAFRESVRQGPRGAPAHHWDARERKGEREGTQLAGGGGGENSSSGVPPVRSVTAGMLRCRGQDPLLAISGRRVLGVHSAGRGGSRLASPHETRVKGTQADLSLTLIL